MTAPNPLVPANAGTQIMARGIAWIAPLDDRPVSKPYDLDPGMRRGERE